MLQVLRDNETVDSVLKQQLFVSAMKEIERDMIKQTNPVNFLKSYKPPTFRIQVAKVCVAFLCAQNCPTP